MDKKEYNDKKDFVNYGMEVDWYITDKEGYIGHFSTAGWGAMPFLLASSRTKLEIIENFVINLPVISKANIVGVQTGNIIDWINMAKRGLFSYDYDVDKSFSCRAYKLIAFPDTPINLNSLPIEIQNILLPLELKTSFNNAYEIVTSDFDNIEWYD